MPWPFCVCSAIFCVCLPRRSCRSRLVLFRSAACFVLFLHVFPATFIIFLWFGFSSFHMIPAVPYFFSPCFFISVFMPIFFIQKDLGLCGPNNVDWIKRVLGPIYLHLPKPFCQRIVFYGKAVFWGRFVFYSRFVFCCRLLLLALLSLEISCSSIFLVGLWVLLLIGFSSS